MRKLGLSLFVSAAIAAPVAAWSQSGQPSASTDDYVCALSGQCAESNSTEPAEQATPAADKPDDLEVDDASEGDATDELAPVKPAVQPAEKPAAPSPL